MLCLDFKLRFCYTTHSSMNATSRVKIYFVLALPILLVGCAGVNNASSTQANTALRSAPTETVQLAKELVVAEQTEETSMEDSETDYAGEQLAGVTAPLLEFNATDYATAQAEGKVILLFFYASWCPICRAEEPEIIAAFNELTTDQVVGFRVHYNDEATTDEMRALANEFSVTYQHTKVLVQTGVVLQQTIQSWDKADALTAILATL